MKVARRILREIDALELEFRVTFLLRLFGLKGQEIANIVGSPESTINTRVFKARDKLKQRLGTTDIE